MLEMIKISLWEKGNPVANIDTFNEMKQQAIAALPMPYLSDISMPLELKETWEKYALQQVVYYTKYMYEQKNLPLTVPYVIIKGSAAAQYYPHPECRAMGDIDIMTKREDVDIARKQLLDNGYYVKSEIYKEICLIKNNIIIELHKQFASLNDPKQTEYLDDLIIDNINETHLLPDNINGLVLLAHINQHLEVGLGLRQIIDWMMFVDKCLPDEKWAEFEEYVNKIGLRKLAITITRICELYLGLTQHAWCANADENLCRSLFEYVLESGNFGNKRTTDSDISKNAFAFASTPRMMLKLLQKQGLKNWERANKHAILRPFAWIYQANRYLARGLKREKAVFKIKEEFGSAKKRNAMFEALGVKTAAKGLVMYKDGKYVKK